MTARAKYLYKLSGTRVLILGGSSGIGFGVAEAALEYGAFVVISSSSTERLKTAVTRLQNIDPSYATRVEGYTCNLADSKTLENEVEQLLTQGSRSGKFDHIVFTAGDPLAIRPLETFSLADMQQAGMVRFFAPLVIAKHLRANMNVNVASSFILSTGGVPEHLMPNWAVIQGYLAGINGLARGLAVDLAPIRVNSVGMGPVDTELWDAAKEGGVYEAFVEKFTAKMTTGRMGRVEDAVECYLYLMKDQNTSGSVVTSNGGTLLL